MQDIWYTALVKGSFNPQRDQDFWVENYCLKEFLSLVKKLLKVNFYSLIHVFDTQKLKTSFLLALQWRRSWDLEYPVWCQTRLRVSSGPSVQFLALQIKRTIFLCLFFFFPVLGIQPRALVMISKCSPTSWIPALTLHYFSDPGVLCWSLWTGLCLKAWMLFCLLNGK